MLWGDKQNLFVHGSVHTGRNLTGTPDSDLVHAAKALVALRERK